MDTASSVPMPKPTPSTATSNVAGDIPGIRGTSSKANVTRNQKEVTQTSLKGKKKPFVTKSSTVSLPTSPSPTTATHRDSFSRTATAIAGSARIAATTAAATTAAATTLIIRKTDMTTTKVNALSSPRVNTAAATAAFTSPTKKNSTTTTGTSTTSTSVQLVQLGTNKTTVRRLMSEYTNHANAASQITLLNSAVLVAKIVVKESESIKMKSFFRSLSMEDCGVIAAMILSLLRDDSFEKFNKLAVGALQVVSTLAHPKLQQAIATIPKAGNGFSRALSRGVIDVKRVAAEVIRDLARNHVANQSLFAEEEGILRSLVALVRDGRAEISKRAGVEALQVLVANHAINKKAVAAAGAITPLIGLLNLARSDATTRAALIALKHLIIGNKCNTGAIASAGGISALVAVVGSGQEDANIYAANILRILTEESTENVKLIEKTDVGVVAALFRMLRLAKTIPGQEAALLTLGSLAIVSHLITARIMAAVDFDILFVHARPEKRSKCKAVAIRTLSILLTKNNNANNKKNTRLTSFLTGGELADSLLDTALPSDAIVPIAEAFRIVMFARGTESSQRNTWAIMCEALLTLADSKRDVPTRRASLKACVHILTGVAHSNVLDGQTFVAKGGVQKLGAMILLAESERADLLDNANHEQEKETRQLALDTLVILAKYRAEIDKNACVFFFHTLHSEASPAESSSSTSSSSSRKTALHALHRIVSNGCRRQNVCTAVMKGGVQVLSALVTEEADPETLQLSFEIMNTISTFHSEIAECVCACLFDIIQHPALFESTKTFALDGIRRVLSSTGSCQVRGHMVMNKSKNGVHALVCFFVETEEELVKIAVADMLMVIAQLGVEYKQAIVEAKGVPALVALTRTGSAFACQMARSALREMCRCR